MSSEKKHEVVGITVTLPPELLAEIDAKLAMLDMTRSQYIRRLARKDLGKNAMEDRQREMVLANNHEVAA